jgi:hypothetical protein
MSPLISLTLLVSFCLHVISLRSKPDVCVSSSFLLLSRTVRTNVDLQTYLGEHDLSTSEIPAIGFFKKSLDDFPPETFFDYDEVSGTSETRNLLTDLTWPNTCLVEGARAGESYLPSGTFDLISDR